MMSASALSSSTVSANATSANKALMHRWFEEVWNQGKVETIHQLLGEDAIGHGLGEPGRTTRGPAPFIEFWKTLRTAFPDLRVTIERSIEEGSWVAIWFTVTMTYTGDGLGFPKNDRKAAVSGMTMVRIENGKLVEGFNVWDQRALLTQLGAPGTPDPMQLLK